MSTPSPLVRVLRFVRFSHTIFALPFALGSMLVAAQGVPPLGRIVLILLAMVFARTAAMTFNRLADWKIDQRNPRTADRHRLLAKSWAWVLLATSSAAFVGTTAFINSVCLILSPVALCIVFFYSLTKRFTSWAQFFLGLALAVSPVGAWLAITGSLALPPLILALGVICWVAGFDLIYATQDYDFDRKEGLHSMVVRLGIQHSLMLAQALHVLLWFLLAAFGWAAGLGEIYFAGLILISLALLFEHRCARSRNLELINRAFFQSNAFVGLIFVTSILLDLVW